MTVAMAREHARGSPSFVGCAGARAPSVINASKKWVDSEKRQRHGIITSCLPDDNTAEAPRLVAAFMHAKQYFEEVSAVARSIDLAAVENLVVELDALRARGGRLFFLGVGGSAANCSHAVNDFRKLCGIEAYTPVDNVSELTARTNDEGWETVFVAWLRTSKARAEDAVFVFSVGGGNLEKNVSVNIVHALKEAKERGMKVMGVVGRDGGYTKKIGDAVVVVPTVEASRITPHTEAFHAVVWHCLVSHPTLQKLATKW